MKTLLLRATIISFGTLLARSAFSPSFGAPFIVTGPVTAPDTARVALQAEAVKFFTLWQDAWTDNQQPKMFATHRWVYRHCHGVLVSRVGEPNRQPEANYVSIASERTAFSVCPTWLLGDDARLTDEALMTDAAIAPKALTKVRAARALLIDRFARTASHAPTDGFIVGQRVRFLVDQDLPDSALVIANACRADAWWCAALRGYVEARLGHHERAEQAFASARDSMSTGIRCQWDDIGPLLSSDERDVYNVNPCTKRAAIVERFWWLADPLYGDIGNERRLAHDARLVLVSLHAALPVDGRYRWGLENGADALSKMILRYGWPSYIAWGGAPEDVSHSGWLRQHNSVEQPPYTTFEYQRNRIRTRADWFAIDSPYAAPATAWQLAERTDGSARGIWWPDEHVARRRPLVQIAEGQVAMLRRQSSVLLAVAHLIGGATLAALGDASEANLLTSAGPNNVTTIHTRHAPVAATLVLHGSIASVPTMVAVEVRNPDHDGLDARTRFGVRPPATLAMMNNGEIAISPPILRSANADANVDAIELNAKGDAVLEQMLGSTRIDQAQQSRIGVYWESYGFVATEAATVSVRVEPKGKGSILGRLGVFLNVLTDPKTSIEISWREEGNDRAVQPTADHVEIKRHSVVLDLKQLMPGEYDLVVGVGKIGQLPVTNRMTFTLVR